MRDLLSQVDARGNPLLTDEDVQLTLTCLHALRHRGMVGVGVDWENDVALLAVAHELERKVLDEIAARVVLPQPSTSGAETVRTVLAMVGSTASSELHDWLATDHSQATTREALIHQSIERLRTPYLVLSLLPRLAGASPGVLAGLEAAGLGSAAAANRTASFALALRAVGLSDRFGWYLDLVPATTLCRLTTMEIFAGRHHHLGAAIGYLLAVTAADEASVAIPGRHLLDLGFDRTVAEALDRAQDAVALPGLLDLAGTVVEEGVVTGADVALGAATALHLRSLAQERIVEAWRECRSSLRGCRSRPEVSEMAVRHVP